MISLHGFGPALGLSDPSPFVLKVHTFLRMSGIQYESKDGMDNLQKAPKGKLPFLKDGENVIADSTFIISYLNENYPNTLDANLSAEQKAQAYFISKSLEESFYWCGMHFRWIHDDSWKVIKDVFFGKMPFPLKNVVPLIVRKGMRKSLHSQGVGRHSEEDILAIAKTHLDHFDAFLGDKSFCFGDEPSSIDATLFAFLAQAILFELDSPLSLMARKYERLLNYCERIQKRYYS